MKKEKLLQKAINSPQNIRFNEFTNLMGHFGFDQANSEGSHFIYRNDKLAMSLPVQDIKGMAKTYQVRQFLEILRRHDVI